MAIFVAASLTLLIIAFLLYLIIPNIPFPVVLITELFLLFVGGGVYIIGHFLIKYW